MYTEHVLGKNIRLGDLMATDDPNYGHLVTEIRENPGTGTRVLMFVDGSGEEVNDGDHYRVTRESKDRDRDDLEETVGKYGTAAVDALDDDGC